MLTQFKQICEEESSHHISLQKKIEKSCSASEITLSHIRRTQKLQQVGNVNVKTVQHSIDHQSGYCKQSNQFIFCLKLKMIGIGRLLENSQIDSQKVQLKDANQILSDLVKKIKNYQKENTRKLNQELNKNKKLEIQIIDLNSKIKTLQADISHLKRQQEKSSKINTNDLKKLQSKIKENQNEKKTIQVRLRSTSQISDQQTKIISELQLKLGQACKNKKLLEGSIFDKQKQIIQLVNEQKFEKLKSTQECQNLKKSVMKKSEEINKLSDEVRSLKQIIDNKQFKIDQLRKKYNKIYGQLQKSQFKSNTLEEQLSKALENLQKAKQDNHLLNQNIKVLAQKQLKTISDIQGLQSRFSSALSSFEPLLQQIKRMKKYQQNVGLEIQFLAQRMDILIKNLENKYITQQELLREQFQIQIRDTVCEIEIYYQRLLGNLEDQIFNMRCNEKRENKTSL